MSTEQPTRPRAGRVLVFTGDGKGKTTAALGLGLRALGHGMRVCVIQFIKSRQDVGELEMAAELGPKFHIVPLGHGFVFKEGGTAADRAFAAKALEAARESMSRCDVLVLDEVNCATSAKLVEVEQVLALLRDRPPALHVVLTGRGADPEVIAAADTVTEMVKIKHVHDRTRETTPGIEY